MALRRDDPPSIGSSCCKDPPPFMLTEPLAVKPLLVIIYRHFDNTYILYISRV